MSTVRDKDVPDKAAPEAAELPGFRLGVVRGVSYGLFGEPGEFMPQVRTLGAGLVRAYLYWGQIEPEPGRYTWDVVDALLKQCDGDEELWITVCSSSPWATRQPTDFLPPSPAHDTRTYGEFVGRLVRHCDGRVKYWQCDNEPSNAGLLWAGTAEEYVTHLKVMYREVKDADPKALVVLGGCGHDVFSAGEDSEPRRFFDHLASAGRGFFDLFSVNLYGDPAEVPRCLETAEGFMRAHGYTRPIVVGEYGGPMLFEFPEVNAVVEQIMVESFSETPESQSTSELQERAKQDTPERRAMAKLYERMPGLPPRLRMFMENCPDDLEAKRHRIAARQLVMRTLLAMSAGVRRSAFWSLAPEVPGPADPLQMMHLLVGKLSLLGYQDEALTVRYPAADTFALLAAELAGAETVRRLDAVEPSTVYAFRVDRTDREPLYVFWDHRDTFDGETQPPVTVSWPWPFPAATAVDALGGTPDVETGNGELRLSLSDTPVLVTAGRRNSTAKDQIRRAL
ncbi:hypothetical protein [Amycolatopsis pigmentata]|uniref:Glycoside hydrolase family 42 N-terminal domain-containing protein n=1 Tax=Amycolatopsis pigmentata TaxID=450801 RepID=A0ABW5G4C3_9PSEU